MRLLDRYLLRELLAPLGYCLSGFLIFWLAFLVFSEMDEFQRQGLTAGEIAAYLFLTLPKTLGYVVPLGLLLAMLYSLTHHARHHELTAIRCAGVSLWRLLAPYLAVGAACGLALFMVNEVLMPHSLDEADQLLTRRQRQGEGEQAWQRHVVFLDFTGGRTNVVGPFDFHLETGQMRKARLIWHAADGSRLELAAERGVFTNGHWQFFQVQQNFYAPGQPIPTERRLTNTLALPELTASPARIRSEIKVSSLSDLRAARGMSLSLREIYEYRRWHPERGRDAQLDTKWHTRLAAPVTCLVVVLMAVPFAARSGRRNVFVGVASSVFLAFAYFLVQRFAEALGLSGRLAPWLAGWLPNLMFGLAGLWFTARTR
jgi:lipopolysaccharide export system permease protein